MAKSLKAEATEVIEGIAEMILTFTSTWFMFGILGALFTGADFSTYIGMGAGIIALLVVGWLHNAETNDRLENAPEDTTVRSYVIYGEGHVF